MRFDPSTVREDFPILSRMIEGRPLAYLDNAATTQKPAVVIDAMSQYYERSNANVHRAVHLLAGEATEAYERARATLKAWFDAEDHRLVLTSGTTESINLVAHAWGRANLGPGDVILLSEVEHHSNIVPWQMLADDVGCDLRYLPLNPSTGQIDLTDLDVAMEGVRLISIIHTSNVLGTRSPLEALIEAGRANGARILIDAAQAVPHTRLSAQALGVDFIALSAHKMVGPTGIGAVIIDPEVFEEMVPFLGGGDMIETVSLEGSTYQTNEHRFEAGTPRIAEAIGWDAAIRWLEDVDLEAAHAHIHGLAARAHAGLSTVPGLELHSHLDASGSGICTFTHPDLHAEDVAHLLDAQGIAVRTGHHCAMPLLERLGVGTTIRASFYLYNTIEEVERLIQAMHDIVTRFG